MLAARLGGRLAARDGGRAALDSARAALLGGRVPDAREGGRPALSLLIDLLNPLDLLRLLELA